MSTQASFRQTVSSFRSSGREWLERVQKNKSIFKERDDQKKEKIISLHLDMRLQNAASYRLNERMSSMRNQAKKLALDQV